MQAVDNLDAEANDPAALSWQLRLCAGLHELSGRLEELKIPYLVLKGVPLVIEAYGGLGHRPIRDIDLLIQSEDLDRCISALEDLSYRSQHFVTVKKLSRSRHAFSFFGGRYLLPIDLHISASDPRLYPTNQYWAFEKLRYLERPNLPKLPILGEEHCLVHLAIHQAQHAYLDHYIAEDFRRSFVNFSQSWFKDSPEKKLLELLQIAQSANATEALRLAVQHLDPQKSTHQTEAFTFFYRELLSALNAVSTPSAARRSFELKLLRALEADSSSGKLQLKNERRAMFLAPLVAGHRLALKHWGRQLVPRWIEMQELEKTAQPLPLLSAYMLRPLRPILGALGLKKQRWGTKRK